MSSSDNVANIPSLTALRGVAALVVLCHHYEQIIPLGEGITDSALLFGKGYLMVDLFFALSGFVMLHVYGAWFQNGIDRERIVSFLRARLARVYPLHLAVLLLFVVMILQARSAGWAPKSPAFDAQFDYGALPAALALVQAWGMYPMPTWNDPSWSISVEWALYLIFPVLAWLVAGDGFRRGLMLAAMGVVALAVTIFVAQPQWAQTVARHWTIEPGTMTITTGFALLRGFGSFALGAVSYLAYKRRWGETLLGMPSLYLLTWLAILLHSAVGGVSDLLVIVWFPMLVLQTAYLRGRGRAVLGSMSAEWLGRHSYSIYLTHPLVFVGLILALPHVDGLVLFFLHPWVGLGFFCLVVFLLSALSYRFVERPARKWLRGRE